MNDLTSNKQDGGESPSAYASAESSPSESMATSLSMHSIPTGIVANDDEFVLVNSRPSNMPVSQSMGSFSPRTPTSPSSTQYINLAAIPSSMSVSGIDALEKLEELNMQAFTSLPPPKSPETVKQVIERTVVNEVDKQSSPKQISPTSQRSSVFSVLGRIFKSASKSTDEKSKQNTSPTASASSSSPNPDFSPFKLLEPSTPSINQSEDVSIQKAEINPEVKEAALASIDKLVQMNDHIHDPILSPSSAPKSDRPLDDEKSPVVCASENMKVPASSQEFCMDLNLNIAAAAARTADAPVAICENSAKSANNKSAGHHQCSSSSSNDHQRFTKNASTSSIHNDLKAILEESKESSSSLQLSSTDAGKKTVGGSAGGNVTSSASSKSSPKKRNTPVTAATVSADESIKKSAELSPSKHSREKKHRHKHSKSSEKKSPKSPEQQSLESKINVLELIMKTVVASVPTQEASKPVPKATPKRNPYRYSRELLLRIRDERAKLIDNICPDIFRTHAYCISGTYWDPEKYFNAMLHGERLYDYVNNNQSSPSLNKALPFTQHSQRNSHYYNNHKYEHKNNARRWVKKNSIEIDQSKSSSSNVLSSFMDRKSASWSDAPVGSNTSDKYLLDLLKSSSSMNKDLNVMKQSSPKQNGGFDLISMLNKKALINDEKIVKPLQPRHSPLILTAQELEFSQLFSSRKQTVSGRTPERQHQTTSPMLSRSSNLSPSSSSSGAFPVVNNSDEFDGDNSSDAYKQLVRNLSNHPLSFTPDVKNSQNVPAVDELFNSAAQKTNYKEKQQQDGANLLKQLLNLNTSTTSNEEATHKPIRHNKYHNRFSGKSNMIKPVSSRKSPCSDNLENLMLKLKPTARDNNEQQHFNMLLDKLMPSLSGHITGTTTKPDDILKWFRNAPAQNNRL